MNTRDAFTQNAFVQGAFAPDAFTQDSFARGRDSGVVLFDDDFDLPSVPPVPPEPEIIEPVFTAAELAAAREDAAREARDAVLAEADAATRTMAGRALTAMAQEMTAARGEVAAVAEAAAEAMARLLLDCFATAFPALSARHGAGEVAAVMRRILPVLHREPRITIRVSPHISAAMAAEIEAMDPDLAARVKIIPTDAMAAEDVRIAWEDGGAVRDTKLLWDQIESILAPAGLLTPARTAKEHALVD